MKPIHFYIFPRAEVERITASAPLSRSFLDKWEADRPGVLCDDTIDVFLPNCRSERHPHTRFDLFERTMTPDDKTLIVVMSWLELFMADGVRQNITKLMHAVRQRFPKNPKIWSWNHDLPENDVREFANLPGNEFVCCYNTSCVMEYDIVLPFWSIEARQIWNPDADRQSRGGFVGFIGSLELRRRMVDAFRGKPGWWCSDERRSHADYLSLMQSWDFALCPRGGGLSSYRFYESLQAGAIPVLFADDVALPYPDMDWGGIIARIPERDAGNFQVVTDLLAQIDVKATRHRIAAVRERLGLAGVQQTIYDRIQERMA